MEEVGEECEPEFFDASFRIVLIPDSKDKMEDINCDIGDVHIGEHDEEVADPGGHRGSGEDVDGGEVAQEADCPDEESGPSDDGPDSVVDLRLPLSDLVPAVPTLGLRGIQTLLPENRSHDGW